MDSFIIARVFHILGVVFWIGGVAMVTTILIPATQRLKTPAERVRFFETVEQSFAWQARVTTLITGLSGFYMLDYLDAWHRYQSAEYWWLHAMTLVWVIFTLMLFVLEPLVLHKLFQKKAQKDPVGTFALIQRLHWFLLSLSLIAIVGAVAGSHGWVFFQ
ncbi:MAG: hypothetical protein COB67_12090 [SAR324 cluster bacterium]|uniref:Copper resistance protein D domain-containing protein n=1 Tax=SAR324 cluster bacterium TaxID=2024889 RepID=A0A2A4SS17_9DELT|nr:MAG: hypothetical protein COB67_12090 [SAR324 cluster bacterium]